MALAPFLGIVGIESDEGASSIGTMCKKLHIPMISHWAQAGRLSKKSDFPFFFRVVPGISKEAEAQVCACTLITKLNLRSQVVILQNLGFSRVAVLYTTDNYGVQSKIGHLDENIPFAVRRNGELPASCQWQNHHRFKQSC